MGWHELADAYAAMDLFAFAPQSETRRNRSMTAPGRARRLFAGEFRILGNIAHAVTDAVL